MRGEKIAASGSSGASPLLTQRLWRILRDGGENRFSPCSGRGCQTADSADNIQNTDLAVQSTAFEAALAVRKDALRASQTPIKTDAIKLEKLRRVRRPC
jgi:hypothetical protein